MPNKLSRPPSPAEGLDDRPRLKRPDGTPLQVPPEGMLGLLALGHVGLKAWRQAREASGESAGWMKFLI